MRKDAAVTELPNLHAIAVKQEFIHNSLTTQQRKMAQSYLLQRTTIAARAISTTTADT